MSSVSSIEDEGISNACTMNVMMNRPVTSTDAMEAMNSAVVSLGFSGAASFAFFSRLPTPVLSARDQSTMRSMRRQRIRLGRFRSMEIQRETLPLGSLGSGGASMEK